MSVDLALRVLVVLWVGIAVIALPYGIYIVRDAWKDVQARHAAGVNGGRESLARLVVTTGTLMTFAFVMFLFAGVYAFIPRDPSRTWGRLVIPAGLVIAEGALAAALIVTQRVRAGVLNRDMASEQTRMLAAATLAAEHLDANTEALHKVAEAADRMTHELGNGPLIASLANTEALIANTASNLAELTANTEAVVENTAVTQDNTEARQQDG